MPRNPTDTRPTHTRSTPGINVASCGARAADGEKPLKFVMSVRLATCPGCVDRRGRTIKERSGGGREINWTGF